jgi:hypothetical protein
VNKLRGIYWKLSAALRTIDWVGLAYWLIMLLSTGFVLLCLVGGLSGCQSVVQYQCPAFAPPTPQVVTALEQVGRKDPSSGAWVVDLEKHYEKCEAIAKLK